MEACQSGYLDEPEHQDTKPEGGGGGGGGWGRGGGGGGGGGGGEEREGEIARREEWRKSES